MIDQIVLNYDSEIKLRVLNYDYNSESEDLSDSEVELEDKVVINDTIKNVQNLLSRIRNLVKMVRKCGNICSYAKNKIKNDESISNITNFIIDFHVRWNSTFLMLKRLFKLKQIVTMMTEKPSRINGITAKQIEKMSKLDLTKDDWSTIQILIKVLEPFFEATKLLSARKYATLSSSFVVMKVLMKNLEELVQDPKERTIKAFIFEKLIYHLVEKTNITSDQQQVTLVIFKKFPLNTN